ncbi:MAG TPA: hypothetical protein VM261_04135 [Kofleriaceae bacterium]|nr:hypothetical protein [Kofleriaceae bacterium]
MAKKKLFLGIGAFLVPGGAGHKFDVVAHLYNGHAPDPSDAKLRIPIDLKQTPTKGAWDGVQIDDRGYDHRKQRLPLPEKSDGKPGGLLVTTVGTDPHPDATEKGAAYLEYKFFHDHKDKIYKTADPKAVWPPLGFEEYELATLVYQDDTGANPIKHGMRYVGFKATIHDLVEVSVGSLKRRLAKVSLRWAPVDEWRGPFWVDLNDPADCDPDPVDAGDLEDPVAGYSLVTKDKPGALFVNLQRASVFSPGDAALRGPKLPIGMG